MASCEKAILDLISKLEPTKSQKEGARRSQNYLRDLLCTGQMESRIINDYLSGSYSRDTAIRPLDDVDIIFVIDPSQWQIGIFSSRPKPESVLKTFANAIRYRYPSSSIFSQRRSVRLKLNHLDIDVVPAIHADSNGEFIWIPDKETDNWIKSSPKRHSDNATKVNKQRNAKFKPLVKLLKYWNGNLPNTAHLKSFAIETLGVRLFMKNHFESVEEGLLIFFDFVSHFSGNSEVYRWHDTYGIDLGWLACNVPDAAGTGSNIVSGIGDERKKKFIEYAIRSRDKMLQAERARSIEVACKKVAEALRIN